jgi:two-component system alkaline phosphatase synthesis response regulator PhoP
MSATILLVEDEPGLVMTLSDLLQATGYSVETALDGLRGRDLALQKHFDLLILDVMLPGLDGFEICHTARQHGFDGGILMLTARSQVSDRVTGLRTGADDYLAKPFDPEELLARVSALLRRVHKAQLTPVMSFRFGENLVDFAQGRVFKAGKPVSLAAKELQLLRCLIDHRGEVLSREQILHWVWKEQPHITARTVDVHVAWLRQKLESEPQSPRYILTVRGEGYRFKK